MSHVFKNLTYDYELVETFHSDKRKIDRVADLYARDSDHRFPIGAGIYQTNAIISSGCNERRSHAQLYPYREALHAEQVAIMSARSSLIGSTIYVVRLTKDFTGYCLARPCFWCCHQILNAGIDRVVYSTDTGIESFKVSSVKIDPIQSIGLPVDYVLSIA